MKAVWKGRTLAESDVTILVEGNHYFPPHSVKMEFLRPSLTTTVSAWKGTARYYDVVVDDEVNKDAAWYYPKPTPAAAEIKDHVAFGKGIDIID